MCESKVNVFSRPHSCQQGGGVTSALGVCVWGVLCCADMAARHDVILLTLAWLPHVFSGESRAPAVLLQWSRRLPLWLLKCVCVCVVCVCVCFLSQIWASSSLHQSTWTSPPAILFLCWHGRLAPAPRAACPTMSHLTAIGVCVCVFCHFCSFSYSIIQCFRPFISEYHQLFILIRTEMTEKNQVTWSTFTCSFRRAIICNISFNLQM